MRNVVMWLVGGVAAGAVGRPGGGVGSSAVRGAGSFIVRFVAEMPNAAKLKLSELLKSQVAVHLLQSTPDAEPEALESGERISLSAHALDLPSKLCINPCVLPGRGIQQLVRSKDQLSRSTSTQTAALLTKSSDELAVGGAGLL